MPPRQPKLATPLKRLLEMRGKGWFKATMDTYYEQSEQVRVDPGWFHPSSLSHVCDAFLAFNYLGTKPRPDNQITARTRRIFDNGHSTEARWQVAIQKAEIALLGKKKGDRNFEIPQYRIRGEMDNVIRHPQNGELYVWEFKTKREDLFEAMRGPDPGWIPQIHCYMFAKGILQTLIVVECKNCQDTKEFLVPFDHHIWKGITDRVMKIRNRCDLMQEVSRTPIARDTECQFHPICATYNFSKGGVK